MFYQTMRLKTSGEEIKTLNYILYGYDRVNVIKEHVQPTVLVITVNITHTLSRPVIS